MKELTKKQRLMMVKKVLEEMKYAENYMKKWNASWSEQCFDIYHEDTYKEVDRKYHADHLISYSTGSKVENSIPFRVDSVIDSYGDKINCEIGRIDWCDINSHTANRFISFKNDGNIYFSKEVKKTSSKKKISNVSYEALYNVLSNGFRIDIKFNDVNKKDIFVSLNGIDLVKEKFGDVEINRDLDHNIVLYNQDEFNLKAIKKIEKEIIETLLSLEGEIPLKGLNERINNYIGFVKKEQKPKTSEGCKIKGLKKGNH